MAARLEEKYKKEVVPQLLEQFKYENIMMVPTVTKVGLNMGLSDAVTDAKALNLPLET